MGSRQTVDKGEPARHQGTPAPLRRVALLVAVGIAMVAAVLGVWYVVSGPRVVSVSPGKSAENVPITAPIRLTLSEAMDPASVKGQFLISPEIDGRLVVEEKQVSFHPRGNLVPGTMYTVTLEVGTYSGQGRQMRSGTTWSFHTRVPELLYLGRTDPGAGQRQLYADPRDGRPPQQLTDQPHGVWDYDIHPQGEAIVYSTLREDGGADLWRMDRDGARQGLLLSCPGEACVNPAWSPHGDQLAYERRDVWAGAPNLDPKAGRIWLLEVDEGTDRPLFDYDVALHSPVWSPTGELLAYISPMVPGVEVLHLSSGELQQFGNEWGAEPVWSPDGQHLVAAELMLAGEQFVVRLSRFDLQSDTLVDISGDEDLVRDESPAWSPGGGWIAFGRQFLTDDRWSVGRQIWLTRPDASEAYALTDRPLADHFGLAWRPDGATLAYTVDDLSEGPQSMPNISLWVFDFASGEAQRVTQDAVEPMWLP